MVHMLPVNKDINMIGMMNVAYPLSVITAYSQLIPWVMENYVIPYTYLPRDRDIGAHINSFYVDACSISKNISIQQQVLYMDYYSQPFLESLDICNVIMQLIRENKYVVAYSDDFYLHNSLLGSRELHFLHETLFYGFDENSQIFHALGMNKEEKYGTLEHKFADVKIAFKMGDVCEVNGKIDWARSQRIIAINRPEFEDVYPYNIYSFIGGLRSFAYSEISKKERYFLDIDRFGKVYIGIDYFEYISELVERVNPTAFRYVHHIYEHAQNLLERISYAYGVLKEENPYKKELSGYTGEVSAIRLKMMKLSFQFEDGRNSDKRDIEYKKIATRTRTYSKNIRELLLKCSDDLEKRAKVRKGFDINVCKSF